MSTHLDLDEVRTLAAQAVDHYHDERQGTAYGADPEALYRLVIVDLPRLLEELEEARRAHRIDRHNLATAYAKGVDAAASSNLDAQLCKESNPYREARP